MNGNARQHRRYKETRAAIKDKKTQILTDTDNTRQKCPYSTSHTQIYIRNEIDNICIGPLKCHMIYNSSVISTPIGWVWNWIAYLLVIYFHFTLLYFNVTCFHVHQLSCTGWFSTLHRSYWLFPEVVPCYVLCYFSYTWFMVLAREGCTTL